MPMWRCPHCGTPQAETARCWVCRRSSTACGTCRNFRRSVAARLGYCGLDRLRRPLQGDEIRGCWEAWPAGMDPLPDAPDGVDPAAQGHDRPPRREFIEVEAFHDVRASMTGPAASHVTAVPGTNDAWTLWGDPDR